MIRRTLPAAALAALLSLLVALPVQARGGSKTKKDDSPPVLIEWVEQPVTLVPLDSRIYYQTVDGTERYYTMEQIADSCFAAKIGEKLAKQGFDWTVLEEGALAAAPEAYARLLTLRDRLTEVTAEAGDLLEGPNASTGEMQRTRQQVEDLRRYLAERIDATLQNEVADWFHDFTDDDYLAIPAYYGVKKDAANTAGSVAKNVAFGVLASALSGGEATVDATKDTGELSVAMYVLDLRSGEFISASAVPMHGIGGAGSETMNRELASTYARQLKTLSKEVAKHNKKAAKELEKIAKQEAKAKAKG